MKRYFSLVGILAVAVVFIGCATDSKQLILDDVQQVEVRSYQTRTYEQPKPAVLRAVVSTLQDLSFIADKVDMESGTVTATKLTQRASLKITIVAREKGDNATNVRANAQFSSAGSMPKAVDDPETYNAFFTALDKAVFLDNEGI